MTGWAGDKYGTAHATQRGAIWLFALAAVMPWTALVPLLWLGRKSTSSEQKPESSGYSRKLTIYLLAWSVASCLFFSLSGNILWTYVLPALPAMALLAARWLNRDTRVGLVSGVVAAGVLAMSLLVTAFFVREELADSWKSAKTVVLAHQSNATGQPLLFMGDLPYSASFYSEGTARALPGNAELAQRVQAGPVSVALNPDQVNALLPELVPKLKLVSSSGAYNLYSNTQK